MTSLENSPLTFEEMDAIAAEHSLKFHYILRVPEGWFCVLYRHDPAIGSHHNHGVGPTPRAALAQAIAKHAAYVEKYGWPPKVISARPIPSALSQVEIDL